jgi:hypothetical protein
MRLPFPSHLINRSHSLSLLVRYSSQYHDRMAIEEAGLHTSLGSEQVLKRKSAHVGLETVQERTMKLKLYNSLQKSGESVTVFAHLGHQPTHATSSGSSRWVFHCISLSSRFSTGQSRSPTTSSVALHPFDTNLSRSTYFASVQ